MGPIRTIARVVATLPLVAAIALTTPAQQAKDPVQDPSTLPYMNPSLPINERVDYLIQHMTLEEKAQQLVNQARAVPHLGLPAYDWWSESLHGVAVNGTTEFPEPVGLAATFDPATIHQMGIAISIEGRIKHAQDVRAGHSNIFEGLDFWAPNINIFRDPRWGRGQETYGEDPYLTGRMGVAFVTGMQGDDPKYYRVISTPKHFAVHSGPEPTRHNANVNVSKHDELDTYLPAFRAAVTEGKAGSIMCAYNRINGQPACLNEFLLEDQLRGKWNFQGYVVSDCGAIIDAYEGHKFSYNQAEASALAVKRGMDNECADFFAKVNDDHDYKPYVDAVKQGLLAESDIDRSLRRLFTARIKLGMFDPPTMVPYSSIDEKELDSAAHRALALKLANESMVLLKNDGTLPLKTKSLKIAVIGPLADQTKVLLGNYNGIPTHTVSVLEGIKAEFPGATITYTPGTQFLRSEGSEVDPSLLTTPDGKPGLLEDFSTGDVMGGKTTTLASRIAAKPEYAGESIPAAAQGKTPLIIGWSGFLTPNETGDYNLGVLADGFASLTVDGKQLAQEYQTVGPEAKLGRIHLEKGKKIEIKVQYAAMSFSDASNPKPDLKLIWSRVDMTPSPDALAAAQKADVVVAVVGITSQLEGEEMPVNEDGFKGGDRTSLDLPKPEEKLLELVATAGKPMIVVLMNGSALGVNWANEHANAILEAWYSGEEGGAAIAQTLSGKNNPGGRLPVTFYKDVSQLPPFESYAMANRTYRYFKGEPLYPFGYGLSYTKFTYSNLMLPTSPIRAGDPLPASVTVSNTGSIPGDEVVQLYLSFPDVPGAPLKALRAFKRVHLEPGATQTVEFNLTPRDLSMVTEAGDPTIPAGTYQASIGGGQPNASANTQAPSVTGNFTINGTLRLPE